MKDYRTESHWYDDYKIDVPSMTVMSSEPQQKFSGLYNAAGNKLYAIERCEPIGFVRFGDQS